MARPKNTPNAKPRGGGKNGSSRRASRSAVLRRPPTGRWALAKHRARRQWRELLELPVLWTTLFVLVVMWVLLPQRMVLVPEVSVGEIAGRTYVADRDLTLTDDAATRELRERARQESLPVFDLDRGVAAEVRRELARLFEAGRQLTAPVEADEPAVGASSAAAPVSVTAPEPTLEERASQLALASSFRTEPEQLELLIADGFTPKMEERLASGLEGALRQGVVSDRDLLLEHRERGITLRELPSNRAVKQLDLYRYLDYPEQVRDVIAQDLRAWDDLRAADRSALVDMLVSNVTPNLTFNSSATLARREATAAETGAVTRTFERGEVIVRKGGRIDAVRAQALRELRGSRDVGGLALTAVGSLGLALAAVLLLWLASAQDARPDRSRSRILGESLFLLCLALVGARFSRFVGGAVAAAVEREPFVSAVSYGYAIPYAALAMMAVLLYRRDQALVLSLVYSLLAGQIAGGESGWTVTVFCLASCLTAVFALDSRHYRQRSMLTRAAFVVGLVNIAAVLVLSTLSGSLEGGAPQLLLDIGLGFAGGWLAAAVTSFTLPILESLFRLTTSIKLVELANPNLPLLRRLAFEAPGTFQHSLAVANLAKAGVEAIDGDSVLVHTGALYHDIGKIYRPQYFIENQPLGQNPHDKIQPSMSALILINHVKEGLEMAEKEALPDPIIDAIEQHHGTRLIKFFYARAQDRCDRDTKEVREEEFRYPGPKPQSKEMGVLMLADAVEAASRTLVQPSRQKLRGVVDAIVDDCLQDGQLDDAELTLGDLRKIADAFLRILANVYHRRVDYPGFDFNRTEQDRTESGSQPAATTDESAADEAGVDEPAVEEEFDDGAAERQPLGPRPAPAVEDVETREVPAARAAGSRRAI
ncbi:MAG: HDIG domain-containing metalloprotein [Acidobacteriota bacterium]